DGTLSVLVWHLPRDQWETVTLETITVMTANANRAAITTFHLRCFLRGVLLRFMRLFDFMPE
ncbi:MAG: hypothetical protein IKO98_08730, partial [Bacteroidales bacterium]|nr:hypothetical protein [Bacteroidales bacterium]